MPGKVISDGGARPRRGRPVGEGNLRDSLPPMKIRKDDLPSVPDSKSESDLSLSPRPNSHVDRSGSTSGNLITPEDVHMAYRWILGRDPENTKVVENYVTRCTSVAELRRVFLQSPEFRSKIPISAFKPSNLGPLRVDVEVDAKTLATMVAHLERNWERLGRTEPHWSVLSHENFRANNIKGRESQFYDSGKSALEAFTSVIGRAGLDISSHNICFELGCGLGRVTKWLATKFESVLAADISLSHLERARTALWGFGITNVELLNVDRLERLSALPGYDVFFSIIVLQHNPPPVIAEILRCVLNGLNPSGIAYFQVPVYRRGYKFDADAYVAGMDGITGIEMHIIPQRTLFSIFEQANCQLLEVLEDGWTGSSEFISNTLLVRKRS